MGILAGAREPTRHDQAKQGLVFLVLMSLLVAVLVLKLNGSLSDAVRVTAELDSVGGAFRPGVDVKMHGMVVGRVTSIDGDARQARVALEIDPDSVDEVPAGVRARVLPASVFGTSYVDLVLPRGVPAGDPIQAGDTIEQDESQGTIELQDALDSLDSLVDALGPAELATALHTLATVLDGRGDDLGRAIDTLSRYTTRFAPMIPRVREDLRLLAVNLEAVARNAPDLLDATDDAMVTLTNLVDRRKQLETLLDGGLALVRDTDALLTDDEEIFLRALSRSVTIVDGLYDERTGLRDSLLETGRTSATLLTVLEDGYARVEGYIYAGGPDDYTRADCVRYGAVAGGNCG